MGVYMKNSKLFLKILITLLTAMLIPFISILSMFFITEKASKDLSLRSGERVLSQFFAVVDNTLLNTSNTALKIAGNKQCERYSYFAISQPDQNAYQAIEVYNTLREEMGNNYYDIFVYYAKDDRIISGANGSADADIYLQSHYAMGEYAREDFACVLNMETYRPHIFRMEKYLCVGTRVPFIGNRQREYTVVIVLKPEFISDLMMKNSYEGEGSLLIFDQERQLLMSSDGDSDYSLAWYDGSASAQEIQTDKGKYMMQVQEATSLDGYYAYVTSRGLFSDYLNRVRVISAICILVCFATGCFAVYRGTSRVYTPIRNVVDKIEGEAVETVDPVRVNELDLIASVLDKNRENVQRINFLSKKNTGAQRKRFILSWIMGKQTENLPTALESYGIELLSESFAVGIIRIQDAGGMDKKQQDFIIQNVFEEIAERFGKGYVVESGDSQYLLLLNVADGKHEEISSADWEEACDFLKKYYNATVGTYFSQLQHGTEKISVAYQEAVETERYRYLLGEDCHISYANVKGREFNYVSTMESRLSRTIVGYIKSKNQTLPAQVFVEDIMRSSGINKESSMESVECFRYEIFSILNKVLAMFSDFEQGRGLLEELILCPTLSKFQAKLIVFLDALLKYKQELTKLENIYHQVADYIQNNYTDKHLTLETIGKEVGRTPYYVSKLFRDNYNMSVSEYISRYRVEQAKKELLETDKSIVCIADDVGFLSATVFIRVFKKSTGMTPGKFRTTNEKAENGPQ